MSLIKMVMLMASLYKSYLSILPHSLSMAVLS